MSTEPIVHKEPPVQSNPFARALPGHVNAGAVAIESERAIAEAQGKLVIAKRFPRDQAKAYANIMDACKRPGLAEEACYSFPRGGKAVSGPSIRLTEMLAANWGNVDYGLRELSRREGVSEMEAYCWDLETNTMSSQKFTVRHIRDKTGGNVVLTDERDIYELTANMGARRLRARILAILPADLAQAAVDECTKTLAGGNEIPLADRVRNMVNAFKALGITTALLEKRLGHSLDNVLPEELADLRKIHTSIKDGISQASDWFGDGVKEDGIEGDPVVTRAPVRERAKKGAAAIQEAIVSEIVDQGVKTAKESPDIQQAMKEREAKTVAPEKSLGGDDNATANVQGRAVEVKPPVPSDPAPAATSEPRAFLKPDERITVICEVVSSEGCLVPVPQPSGDPKNVPSVEATLKGGFNGIVRHTGGTTLGANQQPIVPDHYKPGAKIEVTLFGKKLKSGTVRPLVEAVKMVGLGKVVDE